MCADKRAGRCVYAENQVPKPNISYSLQATESTDDIPSGGHYYLQRQTVDHTTREGYASSLLVLDTGMEKVLVKGACVGEKQQHTGQGLYREIYCFKVL